MSYSWRFGWRVARIPLSFMGIAAFVLSFVVGCLFWRNRYWEDAFQAERSLTVSAQEEVMAANEKLRAAQGAVLRAREETMAAQKLLRAVAPNIVLPHMTADEIKKSAFLVLDIHDLGADASDMVYSTTTACNARGACVTYSFVVDERNLDPVSRVMFKAGRIAVEKQRKFAGEQ